MYYEVSGEMLAAIAREKLVATVPLSGTVGFYSSPIRFRQMDIIDLHGSSFDLFFAQRKSG